MLNFERLTRNPLNVNSPEYRKLHYVKTCCWISFFTDIKRLLLNLASSVKKQYCPNNAKRRAANAGVFRGENEKRAAVAEIEGVDSGNIIGEQVSSTKLESGATLTNECYERNETQFRRAAKQGNSKEIRHPNGNATQRGKIQPSLAASDSKDIPMGSVETSHSKNRDCGNRHPTSRSGKRCVGR
jgi:hypothetical protein